MDGDKRRVSDSLPSTVHLPSTESEMSVRAAVSSGTSNDRTTTVTSFEPERDELIMIYKKILWLRNRQKNMNICINSDKFKEDYTDVDTDELINIISNLQVSHCEEVTTAAVEELSVTRLQLVNMLHEIIEENEEHDPSSDDMATIREEFLEMLMQQTGLSVKVNKEMEDIADLQEEVLKMELELSELSARRSLQMKKIERNEHQKQARENLSKNKKVEKLEKKLEHNTKLLCTVNQIIQSIIGGSTINWAKVSDIKELLFIVSKPLDIQLKECMEVQDAA